MADLLDASVWLPLSAPDHEHHERSLRFWLDESADELAFCRLTQLALLRHLTDPRVMGAAALDGPTGWAALERWVTTPRIIVLEEPMGLVEVLRHLALTADVHGGHWTDAYLAAFAIASGTRLVTFDRDFGGYPGLAWLHIEA